MSCKAVIFRKLVIETTRDGRTIVDVDFSFGPLKVTAYMTNSSSSADFSILNGHDTMSEVEKQQAFITMFNKLRLSARGM